MFGDTRAKCQYCGCWGEVTFQCGGCGAYIDPIEIYKLERSKTYEPRNNQSFLERTFRVLSSGVYIPEDYDYEYQLNWEEGSQFR